MTDSMNFIGSWLAENGKLPLLIGSVIAMVSVFDRNLKTALHFNVQLKVERYAAVTWIQTLDLVIKSRFVRFAIE